MFYCFVIAIAISAKPCMGNPKSTEVLIGSGGIAMVHCFRSANYPFVLACTALHANDDELF
jgi:hypothetical protein